MKALQTERVVDILNRLLEAELAGVVRYTHYSLLVFGYGRIPIVSWLRAQADESLKTDIGAMLRESLETENRALGLYRELLEAVADASVALEEFARQMIHAEERLRAGAQKER